MAGRKHRCSYLDDFQKDVNGEYHYTGTIWRYTGAMPYPVLRRSLWLCCGLGAALTLAAGCAPGATVQAPLWVTLPTMAALVAAGFAVWTLARWSRGGPDLRAYVHAQTVRRLPAQLLAAAICCLLAAIGQLFALKGGALAGKLAHMAVLAAACGLNMRGYVLVKRTEYCAAETN